MYKYYNTQKKLSSDLAKKFKKVYPSITKPQLKIIPNIVLGMIEAESVVTTDIVKKLKGDFSYVSPFSTVRRLERFFNNDKFNIYHFYDAMISDIVSKYNPIGKEIFISFDHMFCKDHFTIFLLSLKIGKQRNSIIFSML